MGAGQSVPSTLTRQSVYDLTKSTRDMMNVLLQYMLKEISIRDFYLLSNPTECKKYVLFLANTLQTQFYELGVEVSKDKRGVLFFRPIKELSTSIPDSQKQQHQSLCLILSYFYTRIFQIFGALALTLVDDASVMTNSGLLVDTTGGPLSRLLPPGAKPYITTGGSVELGIFTFMKPYLNLAESYPEYGYNVLSPGNEIYFKSSKKQIGTTNYPATFTIFLKGAKTYFNLDFIAIPEDVTFSKVTVKFTKIRYRKKKKSAMGAVTYTESSMDIPDVISPKTIHFDRQGTIAFGRTPTYKVRDTSLSVSDYFETYVFSKIIPYMRDLAKDDFEGVSNYMNSTTTKGYSVSESDIDKELRLERTIKNLTIQKPLGHCVARALQLLRFDALKDTQGYSNICNTGFLIEKGINKSGLPFKGDTLDRSSGMSALVQLFYDGIKYGTPKVFMSDSSIPEYVNFMKRMAILFGDYKSDTGIPRTDENLLESGLSGIRNRRDTLLCSGKEAKIIVPGDASKNIYGYVNKLYKTQLEHSKKAGAIFNLLFDISVDKASGRFKISFNDNILKKGIPEINRINVATRRILTEYYESCETTYIQGMAEVLKTTVPSTSATAAPATTTTQPSTITTLI